MNSRLIFSIQFEIGTITKTKKEIKKESKKKKEKKVEKYWLIAAKWRKGW